MHKSLGTWRYSSHLLALAPALVAGAPAQALVHVFALVLPPALPLVVAFATFDAHVDALALVVAFVVVAVVVADVCGKWPRGPRLAKNKSRRDAGTVAAVPHCAAVFHKQVERLNEGRQC